jgi:plastocyanin
MPGPSIRPLLGALGSAMLLGGLVVGGWFLIIAVIFLVYTLMGWLFDFTAEYRKIEEADRTGHLENIPDRRLPVRTLQVFAVLFALVGLAQLGIFPPTSPAAGGVPGASGAPPSGGPVTAPGGAIAVVAKGIAFDKHDLAAPANAPFTIELKNDDPVDHDIDIHGADGTSVVADQPPAPGGKTTTYTYQPLPAGTYKFFCSFHPGVPGMEGTLTVQ